MPAIDFEKHLPKLFPEQLDQFAASEPFATRRPAVVMMTDISGFSALALKMTRDGARGMETLRAVLDEYFCALGAIIAEATR